jgi:hypothetical protein
VERLGKVASEEKCGGAMLLTGREGGGVRIARHADRCGRNGAFIPMRTAIGGCHPARPIRMRHWVTLLLPGDPHSSAAFEFQINPEIHFPREKNRYK